MLPRPTTEPGRRGRLAWLDLCDAAEASLPRALECRGWTVHQASDLPSARRLLLREEPVAAVLRVVPRTGGGPDLAALAGCLSPLGAVPWLLLPPTGTPAACSAAMIQDDAAVADWLPADAGPEELHARLLNLLRVDALLRAARSRAALLEVQLLEDPKTGLHNERAFRRRLREEVERTRRHRLPLALVLLDLDDFKRINDRTSYEFGDRVLAALAEVLRENIRTMDVAARLGGDEFALLLPNTDAMEALAVARRVRRAATARLVEEEGHRAQLLASLGVATWSGAGAGDGRALFLEANEALKMAKQAGKDRIAVAGPDRQAGAGRAV